MDDRKETFEEQADRALREGQTDAALAGFTRLLTADIGDCYAWYRLAMTLGRTGGPAGQWLLREAVVGIARAGRLTLAIAAQRELFRLDAGAAAAAAGEVAKLFGKGSIHLERERRAVPPPPPTREPAVAAAEAVASDPRVLREEAAEACAVAAERASAALSEGRLPFHPLLSELPVDDLAQLMALASVREHAEGATVIEQGGEARSVFIIARGTAEVLRDGVHLATLHRGALFGEMALLADSPRTATVAARQGCILLEIGCDAIEALAGRTPAVAAVLADYTRRRLLRNVMVTSPLFAKISPERRDGLVQLFTPAVFGPGETVIAEGDSSAGLHVVLSGTVRVSQRDVDGEPLNLAELGPGQVFGEISLIQRAPASASVTALGKAVVLFLSRQAFNERVDDYPELLAHIYRLAQQRQEVNLEAQGTEAVLVTDEDLLI